MGVDNRRAIGMRAETIAADALQRAGLTVIERNVRLPEGEIDLVCRERDCWVFVEVKCRRPAWGDAPAAAVSWHKQRRIIRLAQRYMKSKGLRDARCRFAREAGRARREVLGIAERMLDARLEPPAVAQYDAYPGRPGAREDCIQARIADRLDALEEARDRADVRVDAGVPIAAAGKPRRHRGDGDGGAGGPLRRRWEDARR